MAKGATDGGAELVGLERMHALFNWRLPDLPLEPELPLASFRSLTTELNDTYRQAAAEQLEASLAANERLSALTRQLVGARDPQTLIATEAEIATCLAETGAANAEIWARTAQQIQDCCGRFVQEATASVQTSASPAPSANA